MIRSFPVVLLGSLLMLGGLLAVGADPKPAVKPECPVGSGEIDESVSADYKGKKVYFCCAGCVKKFEDDTAKYAVKANRQLVATGQFKQTACPISGKPCEASLCSMVGDVSVAYCCNHCKERVTDAEANEQLALVFGKNFDKAFQAAFFLCGACGQIKGSDTCCAADAATCAKCGLAKGSPGCCRIEKGTDVELCTGCGQIKGSDTCCAADAATCAKCGLAKGSPGCCRINTTSEAPATGSGTK